MPNRINIVPLHVAHYRATELGLLELARRAARREFLGMAYSVLDVRGGTREGLLGLAAINYAQAHYGAARLAEMLLWPEDLQSLNGLND